MNTKINRLIMVIMTMFLSGGINAQEYSNELMGLTKIQEGIKSGRASSYDRSGGNDDWIEIAKGETRTIFNFEGAGIINHIWFTIAATPEVRNDIILKMYWDGNDFPSVVSPIGAFFGQGWDESYEFISLPLIAGPTNGRALVSYFAMPFAKGAKIEIENQSDMNITKFYYYIDYVYMKTLPENTGRFHAWYNKELKDCQGWNYKNIDGKNNYVVADIKGKGHFVGLNYYFQNSSPEWYGEGDDMIFIDGDTLPTLHGTGTEDYFNTSWGQPNTPFLHPYYGYAKVPNDLFYLGRTHSYRFHITDPIFFNKSLRFTFEVLTAAPGSVHDLASVAYWYQDKANPVPPIPDKETRKPTKVTSGKDWVRKHK